MQETRPENMTTEEAERQEKLRREFFKHETEEGVNALMDERLKQLEGKGETLVRRVKVGRNDPCPCGSGRKFKKCCVHKCRSS